MESYLKKQEDVSDILAKDLAKRLIEKDNQDNRKIKRTRKRSINYDEDLDDLKNKTPDEIIANTLENLASLNDLLNHALDKTLGLNEQKTSLNLIDSSNNLNINDKKKSTINQSDVNNDKKKLDDDHLFKVPALPDLPAKKLCKHKKEKLLLKESVAAKNLVDKFVESQLTNDNLNFKELLEDNKLIDDNELIKKHKKKKKDKKEHRCSKHRKRKESNELDELDLDKPDSSTSSFKTNHLSPREHYFEDDDYFKFKDYNHKNYYQDNYDDDRYYSKRSSSNKRNHYDQLDYYSDDDVYDSRSNRRYESKYKNKYYDKSNDRNYDYHKKESDDSKFDYTDPKFMRKLRTENSITNWTKFCSKLSKESANDDNTSICSNDFYSDDDDKRSIISDRILARDSLLKSKEIKFEVRDFKSRQARSANEIKQELLDQFPVSSGLNHQWKEVDKPSNDKKDKDDKKKKKKTEIKEQELIEDKVNDFINKHVQNNNNNGFDIGSIMSQRLNALLILEKDVNNLTALNQLKEANDLINEWSLSKSDLSSVNKTDDSNKPQTLADQINSIEHCEAFKDFTKAAKSKDGIGMALLVKMGWQPGQGLGKNNEGVIEPIIPELKLDTKGLITDEEKNLAKKNNVQAMYNIPQINNQPLNQNNTSENLTRIANESIIKGKHPVNILQEVCSKRKWKQPTYTIISEDGPDHKKTFQYKCTLNNVDYLPSFSSPNKKLAKAISAIVCLQSFGLINPDS